MDPSESRKGEYCALIIFSRWTIDNEKISLLGKADQCDIAWTPSVDELCATSDARKQLRKLVKRINKETDSLYTFQAHGNPLSVLLLVLNAIFIIIVLYYILEALLCRKFQSVQRDQ